MSNWRRMLWSICSNTILPQSSPPSSAHSSSRRHHRRRNLMDFCYIILFLHFFQGVGGATFTFLNNCSQNIWPAVSGEPRVPGTTGFELRRGMSVDLQISTSPWKGRMWGRTGCTFNANGNGSCDTGDCSGRLDCTTSSTSPTTLAEFYLGGSPSMDFYDVSVINGYNLPLLLQSLTLNESAQCSSTGCVGAGDLNKVCPNESRTSRNGACDATRVANYSQVIKKVCPNVIIHPTDNTVFSCPRGGDYVIIFCPGSSALTEIISMHRPPTNSTPQTGNGTSPAQSPGNSPNIFTDYPRTRNGNGKSPAKLIIIVVALGIVCVLIVSIILLCFLKRRRSKSAAIKESQQQMEKFLLQHGSVAPKRYKFSEIKKITKSFNDKLGQGGYGSVYKGMLLDGSVVAVKVLVETDDSSNGEEFMNEVASISKTSHVNIVTLLGFCYDGNKRALVYEFMPNKSLDKFLKNDGSDNNAGCSLDLEKLYKIAVGIAKGLEYLHTGCNTRIVHFDIKPQNILLDEDFCPKISDFGLAKLCKKKQSVLSVLGTRGTIGYIAPEVFSRNFGAVSHKSDVYSYGMMVLEMAGAENISDTSAVQSSENYFPDKIYEHVMHFVTRRVNDLMIEEGEETAIQMYLVGFWCIQTNPRDRPSISRVVEMLEGSVESIEIPPKPVLFAPTTPEQNIPSSLSANVDTQSSVEGR